MIDNHHHHHTFIQNTTDINDLIKKLNSLEENVVIKKISLSCSYLCIIIFNKNNEYLHGFFDACIEFTPDILWSGKKLNNNINKKNKNYNFYYRLVYLCDGSYQDLYINNYNINTSIINNIKINNINIINEIKEINNIDNINEIDEINTGLNFINKYILLNKKNNNINIYSWQENNKKYFSFKLNNLNKNGNNNNIKDIYFCKDEIESLLPAMNLFFDNIKFNNINTDIYQDYISDEFSFEFNI